MALFFSVVISPEARAAEPAPLKTETFLPGVKLAEMVTELTGVAISPMLGVSSVGAWHYFRTPESQRAGLPWFCHPLAWGTGLSLLALCFLKDAFGTAAPPLVKKPLDAVELLENKASALIASASFVPFVAAQMAALLPTLGSPQTALAAPDGSALLAQVPSPVLGFVSGSYLMALAVCLAAFAVVWLLSHVINVLILLSPFGFVDTALKLLRTSVLGGILLISVVHPVTGAVICGLLIFIAALFAPWAFRLSVFGSVMAGDALLSLFRKTEAPDRTVAGFLTGGEGLPVRSFGEVRLDEEKGILFASRFAFIGHERSVCLSEPASATLHRGLLYLELTNSECSDRKWSVILLPRHRHHIEEVKRLLAITCVQDGLMIRGLRGIWQWARSLIAPSQAMTAVRETTPAC